VAMDILRALIMWPQEANLKRRIETLCFIKHGDGGLQGGCESQEKDWNTSLGLILSLGHESKRISREGLKLLPTIWQSVSVQALESQEKDWNKFVTAWHNLV